MAPKCYFNYTHIYGEIPYSARSITLGYYDGNINNPVFKEYGNKALYGLILQY